MKTWSVFRKCIREHLRGWVVLLLALSCAPFFVVVYYLIYGTSVDVYTVVVMDQDTGLAMPAGPQTRMGPELLAALRDPRGGGGSGGVLRVKEGSDLAVAEKQLQGRDADLVLVIPPDFSRRLVAAREAPGEGVGITFHGDLANPRYVIAAIMGAMVVEGFVVAATGRQPLVKLEEKQVGGGKVPSVYDASVPGMLVMATIMLLFTAAIALTKEVEGGTLLRLRMSPIRAWEYVAAVGLAEVLVGVLGAALGLATATALGFRSHGSLAVATVLSMASSLSIVAISLVVAGVCRTANDVLIIGNFPFFLLFFFTGSAFPVPKMGVLTLLGRELGVNDLLPPTHAVAAMNKVMLLGAGLSDVTFELGALLVLTALYAVAGAWLFQRRHLRAA